MKGNVLATIIAVEALLQDRRRAAVNVKFLFEGQEEIGSPQTAAVSWPRTATCWPATTS